MAKCSTASTLLEVYSMWEKHPKRPALGITGTSNTAFSNTRNL